MHFKPTGLDGAWLIQPTPHRDERGSFTRTFCVDEFQRHGLHTGFPQHSIAVTARRGTLRGLHLQVPPHEEIKLIRCVAGAVYSVIVDVRPGSATFGHWRGFELSLANGHELYVPKGFAVGCLSLADDAAVLYLISEPFVDGRQTGLRYNDPALAIDWPLPVASILARDRNWPSLKQFRSPSGANRRPRLHQPNGREPVGSQP